MYLGILPNGITRHDVIVYLDFKGGIPTDRFNKSAYTPGNMTYGVDQCNSRAATFNGTTSNVDMGTPSIAGAASVTCFFNATGWGQSNGIILTNGKLHIALVETNARWLFQSDGATNVLGPVSSLALSTEYFLAITRTNTGVSNVYLNGVASGSANQASGTPAAGSTNLFLGNASTNDRGFNGVIRLVTIYNKVLTLDQIRQIYNKFKL